MKELYVNVHFRYFCAMGATNLLFALVSDFLSPLMMQHTIDITLHVC